MANSDPDSDAPSHYSCYCDDSDCDCDWEDKVPCGGFDCEAAARNGDIDALKKRFDPFMSSNWGAQVTRLICIAAEAGSEDVIRWMIPKFNPGSAKGVRQAWAKAIASRCDNDALQLFERIAGVDKEDGVKEEAVTASDMAVFERLAAAARNGQVDVLDAEFAGHASCFGSSWVGWHQVLLACVEESQLASLDWLNRREPEGKYPSKNGRYDELGKVFFEAGKRGNLAVVQWLVEHVCSGAGGFPTPYSCLYVVSGIAAARGHLAVLHWAHATCPEAVSTSVPQE